MDKGVEVVWPPETQRRSLLFQLHSLSLSQFFLLEAISPHSVAFLSFPLSHSLVLLSICPSRLFSGAG